jgi:glucan phosphorylase
VWLRAWQVQVGRVKLYLLDSNDAANHPIHRGITSVLYGGHQELRLKQEMILGIAGCCRFLSKPVDTNALLAALAELCGS